MKVKKVLMMASVASMIDLFNRDNISILRDMGFEAHVACNFEFGSITSQERVDEFRKELEEKQIKTFQIPVPRSIHLISDIFKSYKLMKKLCEENHYDIVHCHSPIGGVIARLACKGTRKQGTKVIYTAHGFHFFKGAPIKNWLVFYPIERICARYTDVLITINKEDYEVAKKFPAGRIVNIPGIGIHTEEFKNTIVNLEEKRAEFGINKNDFIFMSVGQISKRKNHEVIIKALSLIEDKKVKYLIIGFGELEHQLKELVKELKLEDRVIFGGYRKDIKELLHIANGFAFPSRQEGLPVALMEAMSVGQPIICSRIRGNTDLVEEGQGGYLYDYNDYKGFADGMRKILKANRNDEMKIINQETMKKFDIVNVNNQMKDIYMSLSEGGNNI